jgi:hypothetical protein
LIVDNSYSGSILFGRVKQANIIDNNFSPQMNGLITYQCKNLTIKNTQTCYCIVRDFNHNNTQDSLFGNNFADFYCRCDPRGLRKSQMVVDLAGFFLVNHSCNNHFLKNNARMGGDGFFLAGMTPELTLVGCNTNIFEENDGSYSPNNVFEPLLSRGNVLWSNFAYHSNYGFWLGFSSAGIVENSLIIDNRQSGLAVENGI